MIIWSVQAGDIASKLKKQKASKGDILVITFGQDADGVWPSQEDVDEIRDAFAGVFNESDIISHVAVIPDAFKVGILSEQDKEEYRQVLRQIGII